MSRLVFAAIYTAFILPGLLLAPPAKADPVSNYTAIAAPTVCQVLDAYPTVAGVTGVRPRHLPLLQKFSAIYAPTGRRV